MLYKESVYTWFKHASSYQRIDLLCGLIQMCHPLERRFIASVIEDLCRLNFTQLRSQELKSNDRSELEKLTDCLIEESQRSQFTVALSLLNSSNYVCANTLAHHLNAACQNFLSCDNSFSNGNAMQSKKVYEDVLLMLTIAMNHPAFSFQKRTRFSEIFLQIIEYLCSHYGYTNQVGSFL